jgi:hypothetical protein
MSKPIQDPKRPPENGETLDRTIGCRYSNPNMCRKNGQEDVCAFVRTDNICKSPPSSWAKLYKKFNNKN